MTIERETPDDFSGLAQLMSESEDWADPAGSGTRRRRGRWILIAMALVFVLIIAAIGGYVGWALNAPLRPPAVTSQAPAVPVPAAADVILPDEGASAMRISGGGEYFEAAPAKLKLTTGSNEARPMASISKIVTALVILDAHPLSKATDPGPTITFSRAAHDLYDKYYVMGATIARMPTGSSMSLHDALATMLVPSASNYAEAVSTWAFGSQGAFLAAARTWLAKHGLTGTTMVEPTGMSAQNTSTPRDLLTIGKLASANPTIAAIAATSHINLPGPGYLSNTNDLLGTDGIDGLKTGNIGYGHFNLLYTAALDVGLDKPLRVTAVLLGANTHDSANAMVTNELESIRAGFHTVPLAEAGQKLGTYTTPWGASAEMVVDDNASIFTWSNTPITVSMTTTAPKTYKDGEVVGTLTWKAGPRTAQTHVVISGSITPPSEWWRLTHPGELGGK